MSIKSFSKYIVILLFILLLSCSSFNVEAANNPQENETRINNKFQLNYYINQASIEEDGGNVVNYHYKQFDRDFIKLISGYLAFDSKGNLYKWEDIVIDQGELDVINNTISKGRQFFVDEGLASPGKGKSFPLSFTAPDGKKSTMQIELNIGGNVAWILVGGWNLEANDIRYDVEKGPLDWDTLKVLADVKYDYGYIPASIAVNNELDYLNAMISDKKLIKVNMNAIQSYGNLVAPFTVTLYSSKPLVEYSKVIVHYVDNRNNKLADSLELNGVVGEKYKTNPKSIKGYTLKEIKGEVEGIYTKGQVVVTYIYTKKQTPIDNGKTKQNNNKIAKTGNNDTVVVAFALVLVLSASIIKRKTY